MTTESVTGRAARAALAAEVAQLEARPISQLRTLPARAAEAERRAVELDDEELVQRARLLQTGVALRQGRTADGGRAALQVLAWAERHDVPHLLARTYRELTVFYRQVGDLQGALQNAVECVAQLAEDAPPAMRARHLLTLAVALDENDSAEEAERRFRQALDIATAIGDDELSLIVLNNMAYTAYEKEDEPAATALVAAMRQAQARSGRGFAANELDTIARVELLAGRFAAVEETLRSALTPDGQDSEGDATAMCLLTLAEARRLDGRHPQAQEALDAAVRLCDERQLAAVRAGAREEQAALYAATGRFREAYEEHRAFHAASTALHSIQREARARAMQAVFETTEARRISDHFREMAHRDALTGLYNRRFVDERLPALLAEAEIRGTPLSLAIVDLDHFKRINDTLSHATGDAVLRQIGQLLAAAGPAPALAARLGGEEFVLVFPGVDAAGAIDRCEHLRRAVRGFPWQPVTGALPVTTSIGVTTVAAGAASMPALLSRADHNLYEAKRNGRDRVVADPAQRSSSTITG